MLAECFAVFDLDRSGSIDVVELLELGLARRRLGHAHDHWGEEEAVALATALDKDLDGTVSLEEFVDGFTEAMSRARAAGGVHECEVLAGQFRKAALEVLDKRHTQAQNPDVESIQIRNTTRYKSLMQQVYRPKPAAEPAAAESIATGESIVH